MWTWILLNPTSRKLLIWSLLDWTGVADVDRHSGEFWDKFSSKYRFKDVREEVHIICGWIVHTWVVRTANVGIGTDKNLHKNLIWQTWTTNLTVTSSYNSFPANWGTKWNKTFVQNAQKNLNYLTASEQIAEKYNKFTCLLVKRNS